MTAGNGNGRTPPLDVRSLVAGTSLVVVGGTGFLGKVFWGLLLARYPEIERLHLLVRPRAGRSAEQRFWSEIATSEALEPIRASYGAAFEEFLREKVNPVSGDVAEPFCGFSAELRESLRGRVAAVINSSGVVDFDPPLDEALEVNAFGVQNLCSLARDLGNVPLLHTSTAYTAGSREGFIEEESPLVHPFPRAGQLEQAHWDPAREIDECLDVIRQARHRAEDAFRQSRFLDEAKHNLEHRGEPGRGATLEAEVARVKRKFVEAQLADLGMERARFWGWPNTYTYTKSIGEQIVATSGLPFTIVRPAIVESSVRFPVVGWNEGINTSAPIIYMHRHGQFQIPGSDNNLDFIPCDMVATGMILSLAELLEGTAKPVYHYGASDVNPITMNRVIELTNLNKRRHYQRTGSGGPIVSYLHSHVEGASLSKETFERFGPAAISKGLGTLARALRATAVGPVASFLEPAARSVEALSKQQKLIGELLGKFIPFTAQYAYVFRCDNTRAAWERLVPADRERLDWRPETIDWRAWFLDVHIPGLERYVFPELDAKLERRVTAPARHQTLPLLLDEMTERFDLAVALQRTEADGLTRTSFREWRAASLACAARLRACGVRPGDRVLLAAKNHPAWPISLFGIFFAGATAVPLDAEVEPDVAANLLRASRANVFVGDSHVAGRVRGALGDGVVWLDLLEAAEPGAGATPADVAPADVALLIYTSGTTGSPKGVMLTHENVTALVASLAPLFPLGKGDRVLSVLPLHHTFELTCGLLLPLSRGARVVYLDELSAERLGEGLKAGRITAMVGVPALWEMLERRVTARIAEHGAVASRVFDFAVDLNRSLGTSLGLDAGRMLFGPVHQALGGHLRYLVSGGAALPERTHHRFAGLGLHLAEGYGLTEASPVLTVATGGPHAVAGHVGKAIPGVEIKIRRPDEHGVGEVLARGPNVMVGYADDEEATRQTIDPEGWLHTGDLGKLDRKGHLVIVGRAKDTIVAASGENVYPDDVEARLGEVEHVSELAIVGVSDPRGGERVACVAVPAEAADVPRAERHARAKRSLGAALSKLPPAMRPSVTTLIDVPLPRTTTRKVKRREVQRLVERVAPLSDRPPAPSLSAAAADGASRMVRAAVGVIARRDPASLTPAMTLRGDLGFDSLMLLELLVALETQVSSSVDADALTECETVGDVELILRDTEAARRRARSTVTIEREEEEPLELPPALREAAMAWLGRGQMAFYDRVLKVAVTGRAFLPYNRNVIVAANHASHLDMGLVKYALGSYGRGIVSLAAQDYFFESGKWRRAYFDNLTNLVPISRTGSLRASLRHAGSLLEQGRTVLVFPEGTRGSDGEVHEFKASVGHLALHQGVDILPVWLGGTHRALPKGSAVLRRRDVQARIGPPLEIGELRRLTAGSSSSDASRAVARLARRAVVELSRGGALDTRTLAPHDLKELKDDGSLADVFRELEQRFVEGAVKVPVSFYFALGTKERWTVRISERTCEVAVGKVIDVADCVLKTSPAMFTRIVREAYTPTPGEFISGEVKSNNIQLLVTFQKAFGLEGASA